MSAYVAPAEEAYQTVEQQDCRSGRRRGAVTSAGAGHSPREEGQARSSKETFVPLKYGKGRQARWSRERSPLKDRPSERTKDGSAGLLRPWSPGGAVRRGVV